MIASIEQGTTFNTGEGALWTALSYAVLLLLAHFQKERRFAIAVQVEWVLFLLAAVLYFGGFRISEETPFPQTVKGVLVLLLYGGVLLAAEGKRQLLLIAPFALPYGVLTLLIDASEALPDWMTWVLGGASLLLVALITPWVAVHLWKCKPLKEGETKERLLEVVKRTKFSSGGLLEWGILQHETTAAIIGLFSPLRYVLFSKKMLHSLSPEALEAILAHEIGHSKLKHLFCTPL